MENTQPQQEDRQQFIDAAKAAAFTILRDDDWPEEVQNENEWFGSAHCELVQRTVTYGQWSGVSP